MIDGPPEVVPLAVDLHENFVEVVAPLAGFHALDPALADPGGEHWAEPVPPETDGLVAHIDTALVQQVLDVPQGQWRADVEHHREADDLWAGLEVQERAAFHHGRRLAGALPRLKQSSSDNTVA
jgi:hypothetical protein